MSETIYVAHRGYSSIAPENTKVAFEEAVKNGFGGVECDVWELRKGGGAPQLMIMHDENLLRMCGINVRITEMTRQELSEYPIIRGKNIDKYGGALPIPSYEDYLEVMSKSTALPVIEIKSRTPETAEHAISVEGARELAAKLYKAKPDGQAVIQSFNIHSLYQVAPYLKPQTRMLYLVKRSEQIKTEALIGYKARGLSGVSAKYVILSSASISRIHKKGLQVAVWTVDSKVLAAKLAAVDHVDYIISNKIVFPLKNR